MSEHQLRDFERQWRASGALNDEIKYLQARLRSGELSQKTLQLAAYLEHPAAQACNTLELPEPKVHQAGSLYGRFFPMPRATLDMFLPHEAREVGGLVQGLKHFGKGPMVQAAVHLAEAFDASEMALEAAKAWLENPSYQRQRAAEQPWCNGLFDGDGKDDPEQLLGPNIHIYVAAAAAWAAAQSKLRAACGFAAWAGTWAACPFGLEAEVAREVLSMTMAEQVLYG